VGKRGTKGLKAGSQKGQQIWARNLRRWVQTALKGDPLYELKFLFSFIGPEIRSLIILLASSKGARFGCQCFMG